MIEAVFYASPVPNGVEITGHSFFKEKDKNVLCAAVSAVFQQVLIALKNFSQSDFEYKIEEGYGVIKVRNADNAAIQEIESLRIFLENLSKDYSQLKVEVRNNEL